MSRHERQPRSRSGATTHTSPNRPKAFAMIVSPAECIPSSFVTRINGELGSDIKKAARGSFLA